MRACGPFELAPRVAVAVSGGADSLALALLAADWVRRLGGSLIGLIVDHGLRPDSRAEARQTREWLQVQGIAAEILIWEEPKPVRGVQARAREARYRLLLAWCERHGIVHLLLGHHAGDQAETLLIRLFGGSGIDGLAGMVPVRYTPFTRVLRPLLPIAPARLRATLAARGQPWLEDPANADLSYTRVRFRLAMSVLAPAVMTRDDLAALGVAASAAVDNLDAAVSSAFDRCCEIDRLGFAWLDEEALAEIPEEVAWRLLARLLCRIGGTAWPPGGTAVRALRARVLTHRGRPSGSLGRCRLIRKERRLLVCRERRNLPPPVQVEGGEVLLWDGRFLVHVPHRHLLGSSRYQVVPMPPDLWRRCAKRQRGSGLAALPAEARCSLPALIGETGQAVMPVAAESGTALERQDGSLALGVTFRPTRVLNHSGRFLAAEHSGIIFEEEAPRAVAASAVDSAGSGAEQEKQSEH